MKERKWFVKISRDKQNKKIKNEKIEHVCPLKNLSLKFTRNG